MDKLQQGAYETASSYGRRFREAADIGYPANGRNVDQQRAMLGAYLRGLRDRKHVERLVREGRPKDFLEAQELMAQYEGDEYRLHRALNGTAPEESQEEPMEVGALAPATARPKEEAKKDDLQDLARKVNGMSREFTKLMAVLRPPAGELSPRSGHGPAPSRGGGRSRPPLKFTPDGRPICAACDKAGHIRKECQGRKPTGNDRGGR